MRRDVAIEDLGGVGLVARGDRGRAQGQVWTHRRAGRHGRLHDGSSGQAGAIQTSAQRAHPKGVCRPGIQILHGD